MKKAQITAEQLDALTRFAKNAALELASLAERPRETFNRWLSKVGYELEVIDLAEPFESDTVPLGKIVESPRTPAPPTPSSPAPSSSSSAAPPAPKREATPHEIEGTRKMLAGRKGKVIRAAGPGSWYVLLGDGNEVILPTQSLWLAGAEEPQSEERSSSEPTPEEQARIDGWKELIGERKGGRIVGTAGAGSYTVAFDDGQTITLPEAALPYAGCELPK